MSKDPAFLFYDGDAARDVSHMNRLERGCYFDLIQAQRKFGGYTVEQARKILGKDFDDCWSSIELILSNENGLFFIEWVRDSMIKRTESAEKQRKRIQDYWDRKKQEEENNINHGNTTVLPIVNEIESVIVVDYEFIIGNYHSLCPKMNKVQAINQQRKGFINARYAEYGMEKITEVLRKAGGSDFLNGINDKGWKADFEWIMRPTNFIKILEGKYENNTRTDRRNIKRTNDLWN